MPQSRASFPSRFFQRYRELLVRHVWLRWVHACILAQAVFAALYIRPDLSKSVEEPHLLGEIFGIPLPLGGVNPVTVGMTWFVMAVMIVFGWLAARRLEKKPSRLQVFSEKIVSALTELCDDTLGRERGAAFVPLIGTVFFLVWISNMVGLFPLPYFEEPTANVNFTLGLGTLSFFISHAVAIRVKGLGAWARSFCVATPFHVGAPFLFFVAGAAAAVRFAPNPGLWVPVLLLVAAGLGYVFGKYLRVPLTVQIPNPLDIVGEFGKVLSHSMRLFGNIFGGLIIIVVISKLTYYLVMPTLLSAFFGIFVGTVQAFVFAMLVLVYTAVLIAEED